MIKSVLPAMKQMYPLRMKYLLLNIQYLECVKHVKIIFLKNSENKAKVLERIVDTYNIGHEQRKGENENSHSS